MRTIRGEYLVLIGFLMVVLGAVIPFLIVMQEIKSTLFLNFFAYFLQVGGLFLGVSGLAFVVRVSRTKHREDRPPDEPPDKRQDW